MKIGLREIIFIVLLAAIPLGSWMLIFRPRKAHEAQMLQAVQAKQVKLQHLNKTIAQIGDIQGEINSLEKGIAFLHSKLPSEKEIDKVLEDLWRLAESNQLVTKSIRPPNGASESLFTGAGAAQSEQSITMKIEGDFRGFYAFMLALENQPRIMRVRKMTLTKPDKGAEGVVQATIEMTIFFERDKDKSCPTNSM